MGEKISTGKQLFCCHVRLFTLCKHAILYVPPFTVRYDALNDIMNCIIKNWHAYLTYSPFLPIFSLGEVHTA